eukprot:CAMPEP_0201988188 /NCGR_PEP_ID=MMETSP0904-20121228/92191_1 /ASSEMBLY_ACC=CAM_ASM_000553 /TAXON_ID=420261 /ORGANISM="Thalassiosira antarctica, Strain CCMP982" /LENGTH=417 /DNA_ID=CAMNT_0048542339 /DNA_START=54 /DNA_END=1309 /DNA_ORIENTATION=+
MTSSFLHALEMELSAYRHVDINHSDDSDGGERGNNSTILCNLEWTPMISLKSNRQALSSGSALKQRNHRWTASERAQRVAQDNNLQELLNAEVKKSGYVKPPDIKLYFKNLYSATSYIEKEMNRNGNKEASDRISKSGRFGSLISGMTASTVSVSLAASNLSNSMTTSQPQMTLIRRLRSGDSKRSSICRRSSTFSTFEDVPLASNLAPRRTSCEGPISLTEVNGGFSTFEDVPLASNLAPRRTSCEGPISLTEVQRGTLRQEFKHRRSPVKFAEVDFDPQDTMSNDAMTKPMKCKEEVPTIVSAKIEDVNFDPQDYSGRAENVGEVLQHLVYSDESGWLPWPKQHEDDDSSDYSVLSSTSSYEDNDCGWLPWPGQRDDDSCSINSSISGIRADDECSKYSKNEGNTSLFAKARYSH